MSLVLPSINSYRLTSTYQCLPWNLEQSIFDYLPPLQTAISAAWSKRKELIESLCSTCAVVEYDASDFSRLIILAKGKLGKSKVIRLLQFQFTMKFPDEPPVMSLREFQGQQTWRLDPLLYRYSPRWPPSRMAEELLQHALAASDAWAVPVTSTPTAGP